MTEYHIRDSVAFVPGVPGKYVRLYRPFDPAKCCVQYLLDKQEAGDETKIPVMPRKQSEWLTRCLDEPYHTDYTCYLSDFKNGDVARNAALALMSSAISQQREAGKQGRIKWVRLHQGFDPQVDFEERYAFLVIDNVYTDSTGAKIEKLRDIVSHFDSTPMVIIVSSPGDPLALSKTFSLSASYGILLRDSQRAVEEDSV